MRKADHAPAESKLDSGICGVRRSEKNCWRRRRRSRTTLYNTIEPVLPLGLPFVQTAVSEGWFDWPALPELFPKSFPGVKTSRDGFWLMSILTGSKRGFGDYFDAGLSHEEIARRYPRRDEDHGTVRCPRSTRHAARA